MYYVRMRIGNPSIIFIIDIHRGRGPSCCCRLVVVSHSSWMMRFWGFAVALSSRCGHRAWPWPLRGSGMALAPPASPSLAHAPLPVDWSWLGAPDKGAQGEEGLVRGIGWPRQARAGDSGVPVGRGMGQQGSVLLRVSGSSPWRGRSGERGGARAPPWA